MNYLIPIVAVGFLASMMTGCVGKRFTADDVMGQAVKDYNTMASTVAQACAVSEDACTLVRAGASQQSGWAFANPYEQPMEVAQQGDEGKPTAKPLPLEQVAEARPMPAAAKLAKPSVADQLEAAGWVPAGAEAASKPKAWGDMTPRQRWEHYKAGHNLPEWESLKERERYQDYAKLVATHEGIPPDLFWAQLMQESGYDPQVCSPVGACGIGQFMPATAKAMGLHDRYDPWESIHKAAKYLLLQHKRTGSWELALASYNAGYGAVQKYGGVPPYKETQHYVRTIMKAMKG